MKRIVFIMCAFASLVLSTIIASAQTSHPTRSEQFIIDSLRLEVERAPYETQSKMYSDSLNHVYGMEEMRYELKEETQTMMIPIVSFFGTIFLIVAIVMTISYRNKRNRYRIIEKAIENGQKIPEGLFDEPQKAKQSWVHTMRTGIIYLCLGGGVWIFGLSIDEETFMSLAYIPMLIGLGYIASAFIEYYVKKNEDKHKDTITSQNPDIENGVRSLPIDSNKL